MIFSLSPDVVGDGIISSDVLTLAVIYEAGAPIDTFDVTVLFGNTIVDDGGDWTFGTGPLIDGLQRFAVADADADAADDTCATLGDLVALVETQALTLPVIDGHALDSISTLVTDTAEASKVITLCDGQTFLLQALSGGAHPPAALVVPVEIQALPPPLVDGNARSGTGGVVSNGAPELITGVHTLYATATDAEGQVGPPMIASIFGYGAVSNDAITSEDVLTLGGTAASSTTVIVYDSTHLLGTPVVNGNGNWECTTEQLAEGAQSFTAVDRDASGNLSTASTVFAATVETLSGGAPANIGVNMEGAEYSWGSFATLADLEYVKSEGVDLVRLPIAWEMMQPTLNGPLSSTYLAGLETFLSNAASLGMQVIVDLHNSGTYNPNWAADAAANYGIVAPDRSDASNTRVCSCPDFRVCQFLAATRNGSEW